MSNLSLPIIAKLTGATLKDISEIAFQYAVTRYAESEGWKVQGFRKSAAEGKDGRWRGLGNPGWPDVIACRGNRLLALELKSERGTATPEQREWLALLAGAGVETMLARPRDAARLIALHAFGRTRGA